MKFGPAVLGRGVVLGPDQKVPDEFSGAPVVSVDDESLRAPSQTVARLHGQWVRREPVVVRLQVGAAALKTASREVEEREPWVVGTSFLFDRQRLHFLVWNNNWDMRNGEPIWWWAKKAIALGASADASADVVLPDGRAVYCDGGPAMPMPLTVLPYAAIENKSLRVLESGASADALAPDQREAVEHAGGAARIIAPAGSGKTRVLTERLRHVLSDWNVDPSTVCAVAYNTRAAAELTERTAGLPAHIRTLNSLALAIVNGTGGFARSALESRPREVIGERDVRSILQGIVTVPRRTNTDPMASWIEALSAVRLGLRAPATTEEDWGDLTDFPLAFEQYRAYLNGRSLLDFDEQIYRAIEILLRDPDARATAQRRCRMLLVDEFQDLTPAHLLMLRILASPALDVFGVGDDDQVIYGYAGADPDFLVAFDKWFPGAGHHALEVNYRCPPAVVTAAANTLTRNAVRVAKQIRSHPERTASETDLAIVRVPAKHLTETATETISEWIREGCTPSSIAVLTRVNVTLLPVQVLLGEAGIEHSSPVDESVLERTGMRTALAYLRIGLSPDSILHSDIVDTVRRPSRKIARNVVEMMTKRPRTSLESLRNLSLSLTGNDGDRVGDYVSDLHAVVGALLTGGTEAALATIRDEIGLGETMDTLDGSRSQVDRSAHGDDLAALAGVAHLHPEPKTFEPWLRSVLGKRTEGGSGIELSTVHRVKGREWNRVIVFDASAELMPHRLSNDLPEERRVFHVALTRCRERVVVIADAAKPSRFISEMAAPGKPEAVMRPERAAEREQKPPSATNVRAELGMAVSIAGGHEGTIVSLDDAGVLVSIGSAKTRVQFGTSVRVAGKQQSLAAPRAEGAERIFQALREWRASTARELKLPPYTVLHDSHLEGIAQAAPSTLNELSRCKGIGGTKLERWGDEILAVVDPAR